MPDDRASSARRPFQLLLGWSYDRLYNELAWAYDVASWIVSRGRWRAWQRTIYPYICWGPLLEIGPGPGHLLLELLDRGHDAYGLERSPAMLRRAGRLLREHAHLGRLVGGDALALPFPDASFATVALTFPAGYVFSPAFLSEVSRVLRPGGRLVVVLAAIVGSSPGPVGWALGWWTSGKASPPAAAIPGGQVGQASARPGGDTHAPEAADPIELAAGLRGGQLDLTTRAGTVRLLVANRV